MGVRDSGQAWRSRMDGGEGERKGPVAATLTHSVLMVFLKVEDAPGFIYMFKHFVFTRSNL